METIKDMEFGGERPLYASHQLHLENVTIHVGESSLKECSNIVAEHCQFEGKYVFWCTDGFKVTNCVFKESARSSLWHSQNLLMEDCIVEAPKMFRDMENYHLKNVKLLNAAETCWHCAHAKWEDVQVENGDYLFIHSHDIEIDRMQLNGNYAFQYSKNIVIRDSILNSKDALWETENVTVYNSFLNGEYLAWHSKNVRLVNCRIAGEQPLCYADDLVLENCTFDADANLAFEYSSVQATIANEITSVKNPRTGKIVAKGYGEIILDQNIKAPGNCIIETC